MFFAINNGNLILNNGVANYGYFKESKDYVGIIQADVALTADQRLYAHFMIGVDINELLWSLKTALYLMLGGTPSTHKWNAKDLRNLDSAFRLVFNGAINHNGYGIQSSTGGYADTKLVPSVALTSIQNFSLGIYITQSVTPSNFVEIGSQGINGDSRVALRGAFDNSSNKTASFSSGSLSPVSDVNSIENFIKTGPIIGSRNSVTSSKIFLDSRLSNTSTVSNSAGFLSSFPVTILGYNNQGSILYNSKNTIGVVSINNSALTDQQAITDSQKTTFGQKILNRA